MNRQLYYLLTVIVFVVDLFPVPITCQSNINYLTYALDTAMNIQYRVKTGANSETMRLTDVAEELSRGLTDRVVDKFELISTYEQAFQMQGCILQVSTMALSLIWDVHEQLAYVYEGAMDFPVAIVKEITDKDLLQIDFESFYYELMNHLYESYYHLNDVLYEIDESIRGLHAAKDFLYPMLESCLEGINKVKLN